MSANFLVRLKSQFMHFHSNGLWTRPKHWFLAQVNRCLCLLSRNHGYTIHLYVLVLGCELCVMGLWQYSLCNVTCALATEALICVDVGNRIPINKAGYTANTSCGRVGRGGNAHFHTFQLDHHGPTDGPTDGRTEKASYRVACPQLKRKRRKKEAEKKGSREKMKERKTKEKNRKRNLGNSVRKKKKKS